VPIPVSDSFFLNGKFCLIQPGAHLLFRGIKVIRGRRGQCGLRSGRRVEYPLYQCSIRVKGQDERNAVRVGAYAVFGPQRLLLPSARPMSLTR